MSKNLQHLQNRNQNSNIEKRSLESKSSLFSGPLPDPESLIRYNEAVPNAAERIIKMAENQQEHRFKLEHRAVSWELFQSQLGQIFAFIIAITGIVGGCYIAYNGHDWAGASIVGGSLASIVYSFLSGKKAQKDNLNLKKQQ